LGHFDVLMGKEGKTALSLWSSCHARTGRQPHTVQIDNAYPAEHFVSLGYRRQGEIKAAILPFKLPFGRRQLRT